MSKIDKYKKTGAEGTWKARLNSVENAVLDIIGPDSPVVEGIGVTDPLETVGGEWKQNNQAVILFCMVTTVSIFVHVQIGQRGIRVTLKIE